MHRAGGVPPFRGGGLLPSQRASSPLNANPSEWGNSPCSVHSGAGDPRAFFEWVGLAGGDEAAINQSQRE